MIPGETDQTFRKRLLKTTKGTDACPEAGKKPAALCGSQGTVSSEGDAMPRRRQHVLFASASSASEGSGTTSAAIRPHGTVLSYQAYGVAGLLNADIDLSLATGLLAGRCRALALRTISQKETVSVPLRMVMPPVLCVSFIWR
jgi:hypothetical protein